MIKGNSEMLLCLLSPSRNSLVLSQKIKMKCVFADTSFPIAKTIQQIVSKRLSAAFETFSNRSSLSSNESNLQVG